MFSLEKILVGTITDMEYRVVTDGETVQRTI